MGWTDLRRFGGAFLSLSAATGLLAGLAAVMSIDRSGPSGLLRLPDIPRETMGMVWSDRAVWPVDLQTAALERFATLVAALFLAAASVALLNALVLLFEAGSARWREVSVRAALGATPRGLIALLLQDLRVLLVGGASTGLLLGLTTGSALRLTWPGGVEGMGLLGSATTVLAVLVATTLMCALAYAGVGLVTARRGVLAGALTSGSRVTSPRRAVFLRRALSVAQTGTAAAVVMATTVLALAAAGPARSFTDRAGDSERAPGNPAAATRVMASTRPSGTVGWDEVLTALADIPGMEAETLATPGTLVGLGVRDHSVTQCGACYRGGLPMPMWGAIVDHHAVAPGYFDVVGLSLVEGRALTLDDGEGAPPVAVVNRTFANSSFEGGKPLGKMIKLGGGFDAWFTVVGVVDDLPVVAVGGDDLQREAVYVSALQQPPVSAQVIVRGSDDAVERARAVLTARGFAPAKSRSLKEHRAGAAAPLAWMARVAAVLGLLTLALSLAGARATALQVTRRRRDELAIRRMIGASDRRIVLGVLGGSARTGAWAGAWALFFGTFGIALIRKTSAGVPMLGPGGLFAVVLLMVGAFVLTSLRAGREGLRVDPAEALRGG